MKKTKQPFRLPEGAYFTINGKRVPDNYQVKTGEVLVIQWPVEHGTAHVTFKGKPFKSKK